MIAAITTTVSKAADAKNLAQQLLQLNLVVCAHTEKILSQYNWEGQYYEEEEFLISFKTSMENKDKVVKHIEAHHPYDIPYISYNELAINDSYKIWMQELLG